jgi:hypothetical protein
MDDVQKLIIVPIFRAELSKTKIRLSYKATMQITYTQVHEICGVAVTVFGVPVSVAT